MADQLDRIQKLISLAMNNPDIEESRSAALRAVSLIVEHNITLEGKAAQHFDVGTKKKWRPDSEFEEFWEATKGNSSTTDYAPNESGGLVTAILDTDLDDDFMRKRINIAWRALQRERARLKTEIELEYHQRFQKRYPRPEPVDWEKP